MPTSETLIGSEEHYNYFESLISGRDMHNKATPATESVRKMFPAQVIKDSSMAYCVSKLLKTQPTDSTFFVIMGNGHMGYGYGVPERIWQLDESTKDQTYMVMAREGDQSLTLDCDEGFDFAEALDDVYGKEQAPADLLYVFEDFEYGEEEG